MEIFDFESITNEVKYKKFKRDFLARDIFLPKDPEILENLNIDLKKENIIVLEYREIHEDSHDSVEYFKENEKIISKYEDNHRIIEVKSKDYSFNIVKENDVIYEEIEVSLNFVKDGLIPRIKGLPLLYINSFDEEFRISKKILESDVRAHCNTDLRKIDKTRKELKNATHLSKEILTEAIGALNRIEDYIKTEILQKRYSSINKIQINLTKKQLICLFHLLVKNEYILLNDKEEPSFYRKLEQTFQFFGDSGEFEDLGDARKYQKKHFGPKAERYPFHAIDELQKIFMNKEFYRNIT